MMMMRTPTSSAAFRSGVDAFRRNAAGRRTLLLAPLSSSSLPSSRASYHATPNTSMEQHGGIGLGNVYDRMLPTSDRDADRLFRLCKQPKTVSIIGAPMTYGQPYVGTDSGPTLLREAGLLSNLSSLGWRVEDLPDLDFDAISHSDGSKGESGYDPKAKHSEVVGAGASALADLVETKLRQGRFPLVLGGDHSIGIGSLAGILRAKPRTGVIWVDAHADLNTPDISESGNMHGMPIGILMEGMVRNMKDIRGLEWLAEDGGQAPDSMPPRLKPDSIVYVGLRDVDAAERSVIRELGIQAFTMSDIDHCGIGKVMDMTLAHLLKDDPNRPIHLSYDIDAVDPSQAPATGTAVRGGLTFREAHYVAEAAAKSGVLASAEMVELNPTLSDGHGARETVELGLHILTSLMGKSII